MWKLFSHFLIFSQRIQDSIYDIEDEKYDHAFQLIKSSHWHLPFHGDDVHVNDKVILFFKTFLRSEYWFLIREKGDHNFI